MANEAEGNCELQAAQIGAAGSDDNQTQGGQLPQ